MALKTTQEMLETVETAIDTILNYGQSYTIGNRKYTRADLKTLQEMRQSYREQYDVAESGGMFTRVQFERPL